MARELIPVTQAAESLGVSATRLRKLCREGRVKGAQKVGWSWVVPANPQIAASGNVRPGKLEMAPAKKR